jgi:predicted amidohydrolase
LAEVYPHLEPSGAGISSLWARTTALRYNCNVITPYPEKVESSLAKGPAIPEYYNSAIIVNQDGETAGHYRKSHLYTTDETWALEGTQGFYHGKLDRVGSTAMGLSMDLK